LRACGHGDFRGKELKLMRKGFDPTRRNRNIGTRKRGYGGNNRFQIPSLCHAERLWWEMIGDFQLKKCNVEGIEIVFIIETTHAGCIHACSVADICRVFSLIPKEDWTGIGAVILRQPTHKQRAMQPVWGRLAYKANIGKHGKPDIYSGAAILLEACNPATTIHWAKALSPESTKELERLKEDGHEIEDRKKYFSIVPSLSAIRATQLYRTIPHEIGHWVDWQQKVLRPANLTFEKCEVLEDLYFSRPREEREAFAHRYAIQVRKRLCDEGAFPFARIADNKTEQP
jgi:hypothetical protein